MLTDEQFVMLERRLMAAMVDVVMLGAACAGFIFGFDGTSGWNVWIWGSSAAVLLALAVMEAFAGITPGKWLLGWSVRGKSGKPATLGQLALRAGLRWLPIGLLLPIVATDDAAVPITLVLLASTVMGCYLAGCYIAFLRWGDSLFDVLAGTRVVRLHDSGNHKSHG